MAKKITSSLGGLSDARKGIMTEEGREMADKRYQRDDKKADIDGDGKLTPYEKVRADAVQQAMSDDDPERDEKIRMYHGGMACGMDEGMMSDPESGNTIPIGSSAENVRDDIEVMMSDGEYVLPANVVKWHGLKRIMELQTEAEMGLMSMYGEGLIQYAGGEDADETADDSEPEEEDVIETPEGNEIEIAEVEMEEITLESEYPEEGDEGYYPSENRSYSMMKTPKLQFII